MRKRKNVYKAGEIHVVYIPPPKEIGRFSSKDKKITKYDIFHRVTSLWMQKDEFRLRQSTLFRSDIGVRDSHKTFLTQPIMSPATRVPSARLQAEVIFQ